MDNKWKGTCAVVAGFITQLFCGMTILWGAIAPYIAAYFREYDPELTNDHLYFVYPVQVIIGGLGMYPGTLLALQIGSKMTIALAGSVMVLGMFISSYWTSILPFLFLFNGSIAAGFCIASGMALMPAWSFFPEKRMLFGGLIMSGIPISCAAYNLITFKLVNPENELPSIRVPNGRVFDLYFDFDIAQNLPYMIRWLCVILAVCAISAAIIMPNIRVFSQVRDAWAPANTR